LEINKKYKYWEFYYDESNGKSVCPTKVSRQCVASIWDEEWRGVELLKYSDEELRTNLLQDIEDKRKYEGVRINKGLIRHAIAELRKIKEELGVR
jgi:hypothetical protein